MVAVSVWVGIAAGGPVVWVADQRVWMGILLRDVSRGGGYKDKGERVSALWGRRGGGLACAGRLSAIRFGYACMALRGLWRFESVCGRVGTM